MAHKRIRFIKFRQFINRMGAVRTGILITATSMATSVFIRMLIWLITGNDSDLITNFIIAALVPFIIAPIMSYFFVGVLAQIDEAELRNANLVTELQQALAKAKMLRGLLPICATCKKIRDDAGYWHQVEVYIHDHAEVDFSHGICPGCEQDLQDQIAQMKHQKQIENE